VRVQVVWLKNEERLKLDAAHKYRVVGNGTELSVGNIDYADTGAYMCQASNVGGVTRDISSLIVQEVPTPGKCAPVYSRDRRGHGRPAVTYVCPDQPRRKKNAGFSRSTIGARPCTSPPLAGSTTRSSPPTSYPEPRYVTPRDGDCEPNRPDCTL